MPNEAASAAIDSLMDCLLELIPEEYVAVWVRCVVVDGRFRISVCCEVGSAENEVQLFPLEPEAEQAVIDRFRSYQEAVKVPGLAPWQVASLVAKIGSEGRVGINLDTDYETVSESDWDRFAARWNDKYLAGRRIVPSPMSRPSVATPPPLPLVQPPMEVRLMKLLEEAFGELKAKNEVVDQVFNLRQSSWSLDQTTCAIRFHNPNGTVASAPFQTIGTINTKDGTWLWAWENPSITEPLRRHALAVRAFGEAQHHELLTTRKFPCDEELAWRLTALAAKLNNAQGAYRAPAGTALLFLTFGKVTLEK